MKISVLGDAQDVTALGDADLVLVCADAATLPLTCERLGQALADHEGAPVVAIGTAVLPGTTRQLLIPALEKASGKRAGEDFGVCVEAHSLRHGTLIGELNRASGEVLAALYAGKPGRLVRTDLESAEMFKHAEVAWNALKAGFANEIGTLCKAHGVDAFELLELLSPGELAPGFAFAGAAPVGDLLERARSLGIKAPILDAIPESNALQIERAVAAVAEKRQRRVGILGLQGGPMMAFAQRLIEAGFELRIYGNAAGLEGLTARTVDEVLAHAQTIVVGSMAPEFADLPRRLRDGQTVIDFVRACDSRTIVGLYEGLCW